MSPRSAQRRSEGRADRAERTERVREARAERQRQVVGMARVQQGVPGTPSQASGPIFPSPVISPCLTRVTSPLAATETLSKGTLPTGDRASDGVVDGGVPKSNRSRTLKKRRRIDTGDSGEGSERGTVEEIKAQIEEEWRSFRRHMDSLYASFTAALIAQQAPPFLPNPSPQPRTQDFPANPLLSPSVPISNAPPPNAFSRPVRYPRIGRAFTPPVFHPPSNRVFDEGSEGKVSATTRRGPKQNAGSAPGLHGKPTSPAELLCREKCQRLSENDLARRTQQKTGSIDNTPIPQSTTDRRALLPTGDVNPRSVDSLSPGQSPAFPGASRPSSHPPQTQGLTGASFEVFDNLDFTPGLVPRGIPRAPNRHSNLESGGMEMRSGGITGHLKQVGKRNGSAEGGTQPNGSGKDVSAGVSVQEAPLGSALGERGTYGSQHGGGQESLLFYPPSSAFRERGLYGSRRWDGGMTGRATGGVFGHWASQRNSMNGGVGI